MTHDIRLIVYKPESEAALARQAAMVHADAVSRRLEELPCPEQQKQSLLKTLIRTVAEQ